MEDVKGKTERFSAQDYGFGVMVNGKWYNTADEDLKLQLKTVEKGQQVHLVVEGKEIRELKWKGRTPAKEEGIAGEKTYWERKFDFDVSKQEEITRMGCLNSAIQTLNNSKNEELIGNDAAILALAENYVKWVKSKSD